jgi:hypothetical protein
MDNDNPSAKQMEIVKDLLWDYLPTVPDRDDVRRTGWGMKTLPALTQCVMHIAKDHKNG